MRGIAPPRQLFLPFIGVVLFFFAAMYSFARQQPSQDPAGSGQRENLSYSKPASPQAAAPQEKTKTPPPPFSPSHSHSQSQPHPQPKQQSQSKKSSLKTNVISSPAPHSFVHVSHVGVNTRGIIESSKNIEPAWGALIADLQGYGISPEVLGDNMGFIKDMVSAAGVPNGPNAEVESPVTPQSPHIPSPTPVSPPPEKKLRIRRKVLIL